VDKQTEGLMWKHYFLSWSNKLKYKPYIKSQTIILHILCFLADFVHIYTLLYTDEHAGNAVVTCEIKIFQNYFSIRRRPS